MIIDGSELALMDGQGLRLMSRARDWASPPSLCWVAVERPWR
jgi:hypothetical protein